MTEGVVKYRLDFRPAAAASVGDLGELPAWHSICHRLGLLGRDPARYGGLAYGNLSRRLCGERFLISGTQTGGQAAMTTADYALVEDCDIDANRVRANGPVPPSSEALTHAAVYRAAPAVGCVFHVHAPQIWLAAQRLGLAVTDPAADYGTPAMAREVARLLGAPQVLTRRVFVMGGHQDGVLAFGGDAAAAGTALIAVLARALTP